MVPRDARRKKSRRSPSAPARKRSTRARPKRDRPARKWVVRDAHAVRDASAVRDARAIKDARVVHGSEVGKADVPIRRARAGVPQERVAPPDVRRRTERRPSSRRSEGPKKEPHSRKTGRRPTASILASQPWDMLAPLLVGSGSSKERLVKLKRYGELLLEWNRSVSNLISRNDEVRLVERHLRESVEPARWLAESGAKRWLDFGSGGGLPAFPLAIAGVGERWTLVESRRTKTLFLRKAQEDLGLANIEVVLGRLENVIDEGSLGAQFDGFTSRATLTLVPTLMMAAKLVRQDGYAFLWKGSRRSGEMEADDSWKSHWDLIEERVVGVEQTNVVKFKRMS